MWMKHAEHGGVADLPDLEYWRANGWEPAAGPPPEPDVLHDPALHDQPTEQPEATETPADVPGSSASEDEEMTHG